MKVKKGNGDKKPKQKYVVKTKNKKSKGVVVNKRAVDSAKTKTGAFKPMKYKGKKVVSKGRTTAYKDQSGKVYKATNKMQSRSLDKKAAYDRKKFVKDSTNHAAMTKRFASAKKRGY